MQATKSNVAAVVALLLVALIMAIGFAGGSGSSSSDTEVFVRAAKRDYCSKVLDEDSCLRHDFRQPGLTRYCMREVPDREHFPFLERDWKEIRSACVSRGHAWSLVFARYGAIARTADRRCDGFGPTLEGAEFEKSAELETRIKRQLDEYVLEIEKRVEAGLEKPPILPSRRYAEPICPVPPVPFPNR